MKISPSRFRRAFQRFLKIESKANDQPLDDPDDVVRLAFEREGYKRRIPPEAAGKLKAERWSPSMIATTEQNYLR